MMHPDDTRYLSLGLLILALAAVVTCAPGCGWGDDDDGFTCDRGQGANRDGNLRSPVEACVLEKPLSPRHIRDCVLDLEDDEVKWICTCRPDQCEATRDFYDELSMQDSRAIETTSSIPATRVSCAAYRLRFWTSGFD